LAFEPILPSKEITLLEAGNRIFLPLVLFYHLC
jgi:hypothetical protein